MKSFVGIDLGGTIIKIGLVSGGRVLGTRRLDANSQNGLRPSLPGIGDAIDSLVAEAGPEYTLCGIALAFCGIVNVDAKRPAATNAKYNDAPDIDLQEWAMKGWGVPFAIDNDARMAMVGEWKAGAGKGCDNMVMMTIGTGIGTGAVIDGRPLHGKNFCAGSLGGHMIVDYRGRRCTCGNIGCVEAHGSSFFLPQIIADAEGVSAEFKADASVRNFKALFDRYRASDPDAVIVVESCMDVWAAGIVNYIHAYDPETVVVGGGIMKSSDIIIPYLQSRVDALAWCPAEKVKIVPSALGDDAAVIAAEFYFQN